MPNYDLGTAHGQIVIDYDNKGTAQASQEFTNLGKSSDSLKSHISGLGNTLSDVGRNFGSIAQNFGRNFAIISGGAGVLGAVSLSARGLGGSLLGLRSGISILGALRTVIGGVPKSIQGFPNVLKQIVLLSAGISLLGGGLGILTQLAQKFQSLSGAVPILEKLKTGLSDVTAPVKNIAKLVLTIGTFITAMKQTVALAAAMAKLGAVIGALTGAIHIIGELVAAAGQLSGALLLLPAAGVAAAVTMGTLALGLKGFSKALKDAGNPALFAKDLKNLAPAAQDAAKALTQFQGGLKGLQLGVQQALFQGLGDQIRQLGAIYLPIVSSGLQAIAGNLNAFAKQAADFFKFPDVAKDVSTVLGNIHQALTNLIPAWDAVLSVMDDVVTVGSGFLPKLASEIGTAAANFASFINNARLSGQLAGWIQGGIDAFHQLWQLIVNVGSILSSVFTAFGANTGGLLGTLANLTGVLAGFLKTAEGSQALKALGDIFNQIGSVVGQILLLALQQLGPIIVALLPFVKDLITDFGATFIAALKVIGPLLLAVATALSKIAPFITPFVGALFTIGVIGAVAAGAINLLTGAIGLLTLGVKIVQGTIVLFRSIVLSLQVAFWLADAGALGLLGTLLLYGAIFLAIAAVVAIVVILIIKYWSQISSFFITIWNFIKNLAITVWGAISSFFEGLWNHIASFFSSIWSSIIGGLTAAWNGVVSFFSTIGSAILHALESAGGAILQGLQAIGNFFAQLPGWILQGIVAIPGLLGDAFHWMFTTGINALIQGIEWVIAEIIVLPAQIFEIFMNLVHWFQQWFLQLAVNFGIWITNVITAAVVFFQQLPGRIINALASFGAQLILWITTAWNFLYNQAVTLAAELLVWFQQLPGRIINALASFGAQIVIWITDAWNAMKNGLETAQQAVDAWFYALPGRILSFLQSAGTWLLEKGVELVVGLVNGITNQAEQLWAWIRGLPGQIGNFFSNAGQWLVNAGRAILNGFLNGVKAIWNDVTSFFGGIGDKIKALKGPLPKDKVLLVDEGTAIMQGFHSALVAQLPPILDFVKTIAPQIQASMGKANANVALGVTAATTATATLATASAGAVNAPTNATRAATAAAASGGGTTVQANISNLNVAGNLDPTDPVKYRQSMKSIRDSLRDLDRSSR